MCDFSDLKKDAQAQEIYRYFYESLKYIESPTSKTKAKSIPKLPRINQLPIKIEEGIFALLSSRLISLMPHGVLEVLNENLMSLVPEVFVKYDAQEHLSLLSRESDYKSFLDNPFNQQLLEIFKNLPSNHHGISLYHFAVIKNDVSTLAKLLSHNTEIAHIKDAHGNGLLHFACLFGEFKDKIASQSFDLLLNIAPCKKIKKSQVKELVANRANIENSYEETPLHIACKKNNIIAANKLLSKGADSNVADSSGYLPIHRALEKKNTPLVNLLAKYSNPEQLINDQSILSIAYNRGDDQLVNYLINKHISINLSYAGTTILHEFCTHNEVALVQKLLSAGLNQELVNFTDDNGATPFRIAFQQNNYTMMSKLLEHGADPDFVINGSTALHEACESGDYSLVKFLLEHGADPYLKNSDNNDCRDLIAKHGNSNLNFLIPKPRAESDDATIPEPSGSDIASDTTEIAEELLGSASACEHSVFE